MNSNHVKKIGLLIGREWDWPSAFMKTINEQTANITAELVKLGGTNLEESCPYDLIIDRMSHHIPYYRAYVQQAALQGCTIINNPFTWSADNKFLGNSLAYRLGMATPRTVVLPNKYVQKDVVPDSFRNLVYPMDWQGIIDYVGVPAIFKDIHSGGRRAVYRVHSVDELLDRYDETGTRTMILQQIIESDFHVHCFVIGQEKVLPLRYSRENGRYLPETLSESAPLYREITANALKLTQIYGYDINMVEFVIKDNTPYVINSTNPAPVIDLSLMTQEQFDWCVQETVSLAIARTERPLPANPFNLDPLT
ncbi:MAG: hypothetical protein D6706_09035 [Chloroflexi bacterium]|nr:MAG: hypothetical protein D6706_09035 [Chloroflexota bacterium]